MITKEDLAQRIFSLQEGMKEIEENLRTLDANRHATSGALQEAQCWLKVLIEKEKEGVKDEGIGTRT